MTSEQNPATSTEADVLADICSWSESRPAWQREALRRLYEQGVLSENDIQALANICESGSTEISPLLPEHIKDPKAATATVQLKAIHSVENINALASDQRMTFDKKGLTIIYGDNGSGKSGYARILKKVCRARSPKDEKILPNVYESHTGAQKAEIDYTVNGQNLSAQWLVDQQTPGELSSISVFDSATANIHVDETNNVAYTPFPMKLLEGLASACKSIKSTLDGKVKTIERQTPQSLRNPQCQAHTATGKLISSLKVTTKSESVEQLAGLSAEETARLETIKGDLAQDPAKAARKIQKTITQLEAYQADINALISGVSQAPYAALNSAWQTYETAKNTAKIAAGQLFEDLPLEGVGSDSWIKLWEAARGYSEQQAYQEQPFPVTDEEAKCVLCQQDLSPSAKDRVSRFEAFIKDDTKQKEQQALQEYQTEFADFDDKQLAIAVVRSITTFIRDDLNDENLAQSVRNLLIQACWQHRKIRRIHQQAEQILLGDISSITDQQITDHLTSLQERKKAFEEEGQSEERIRLIAECQELEDRQWLGVVKGDVLAEINRKQQIAALKKSIKETATQTITAKSSEISELLVTHSLRSKFVQEVNSLGVAGLAIDLTKAKTSYGVPLFRVSLINQPSAKVGEVLSEGEHRCVALAAFMAELATTESDSAIIFDDPVSSLDHMHRQAVAERLVDEGQNRQVIVFTHDIAFLFLLHEFGRERGTHIAFRSIARGPQQSGFCNQNPPANAQPVSSVIQSIQNQLNGQKFHYEQGNQDEWYRVVRSLQEQLRTTWERAVEDAVAPVVKRLSHKVTTPGLSQLTVITLDDCKVMRDSFGRCSALLHSESEAINAPLPQPDRIQEEIDALKIWVEGLKERQRQVVPV